MFRETNYLIQKTNLLLKDEINYISEEDENEYYNRDVRHQTHQVNQKYRNLKRRKINPQRVTKYDHFTADEEANIGRPQATILPKSYYSKKKINYAVTIKWNCTDTQSGYLKHRIDSLDYWCMLMAQERLRVRENLIDYSYKYQDIANQKLPPSLFDANGFYNQLHDQNLTSDVNYHRKAGALDNWKKRNYGEVKYKEKPNMKQPKRVYHTDYNRVPTRELLNASRINLCKNDDSTVDAMIGSTLPYLKQRPSTDSELQNILNFQYRGSQPTYEDWGFMKH